MRWFEEISRSLAASGLLVSGDKKALWRFNLTNSGFWRSFIAILLVLPLYFFMSNSFLAGPENAGKASFLNVIFKLLIQWVVWLTIMVFVTRMLGLANNYVRYVIVSNWTSVVVVALISLPVVFYEAGFLGERATVFITVIARLYSLYFSYYITRLSLGTSAMVAIAIVIAEFVTSMSLLLLIDKLSKIFA